MAKGRPRYRTAPSVPVSARVDQDVAEAIDAMAADKGVKRAVVIQRILHQHVAGKKEADTDGQL